MHRKRVLVGLMMVSSVVAACSTAPPDEAAVTAEVADLEATPPAEDVSEPEPAEDDGAAPFGDARDDGGSDARDDAPEEASDGSGSDDAEEAADGTDRGANDASDPDADDGSPTADGDPYADDGSPTADGDPYAIPEDGIDEAYVERVLNAIFEVNREALQLTLDSEPGGLAPFEAEEMIRSIYGPDYGRRQLHSLHDISRSAEQRDLFVKPLGSYQVSVTHLIDDDPKCVRVRRAMDFANVLVDPPSVRQDYVALRYQGDTSQNTGNPTPYLLFDANIDDPERLSCG
jgi:hypothetical protein